MLFEALVSRLDPGSQRLKEACNGGLFLRADGFVTTAHAYRRAVPEVSDEGGMNLLLLGDGHLPIRPNQTPSKLSELVLVIEGAMVVAPRLFDDLGVRDAELCSSFVDACEGIEPQRAGLSPRAKGGIATIILHDLLCFVQWFIII